ncbi:MAG: DUF454 domain-containing protein [Euryarchaeota archaeon]|nr:DUF454 domain-containing protein [Euryarchaeota archaeon]
MEERAQNAAGEGPAKEGPLPGRMLRAALVGAGTVFLALGVVGIVLPILPTTPFLLLAAACYARSSRRFHDWLLGSRYLGGYIRNYRDGLGIPLRDKALSIALLWLTIIATAWLFHTNLYIRIVLVTVAAGVTVFLLTRKTRKGRGAQGSRGRGLS